ncbi:MAG: hypothetical protein CVV37_05425 [Nitrospira bacterium HGW-Nitrospira-1]|nr:MAG: hypothetical protein CVV37_05425 [Nitrospira bacterium HGW-Nitrospira-1]
MIGDRSKGVKTERITLEFFKILNLFDPFIALKMMIEHMILTQIICLSNKELLLKLKAISELNKTINEKPLKNLLKLNDIFSQGLSYRGLLRLEVLLKGASVNLLNLSSRIKKRIIAVDKANNTIKNIREKQREALYNAFKTAGDASRDFLIINNMQKNMPELKKFMNIERKALLSAQEIMDILGVSRGVIIGKAKEYIKKAEFCGRIRTKRDAAVSLKREFECLSI